MESTDQVVVFNILQKKFAHINSVLMEVPKVISFSNRVFCYLAVAGERGV
jgi:hypothetical protein